MVEFVSGVRLLGASFLVPSACWCARSWADVMFARCCIGSERVIVGRPGDCEAELADARVEESFELRSLGRIGVDFGAEPSDRSRLSAEATSFVGRYKPERAGDRPAGPFLRPGTIVLVRI